MSSATDDKIKTEIEPFGTVDVDVFDKSVFGMMIGTQTWLRCIQEEMEEEEIKTSSFWGFYWRGERYQP